MEVVREADFGVNDDSYSVRTRLGGRLEVGDTVLGYDLQRANLNVDGSGDKAVARRTILEEVLWKSYSSLLQ